MIGVSLEIVAHQRHNAALESVISKSSRTAISRRTAAVRRAGSWVTGRPTGAPLVFSVLNGMQNQPDMPASENRIARIRLSH